MRHLTLSLPLFLSLCLLLPGSAGGEQRNGTPGAEGGARLAASRLPLLGQLSCHWPLPVRRVRCYVPHVTFPGEYAPQRRLNTLARHA